MGSSCPVCLDTVQQPTQLSCAHVFCGGCVAKWLRRKPSCPVCRTNIDVETRAELVEAAGMSFYFNYEVASSDDEEISMGHLSDEEETASDDGSEVGDTVEGTLLSPLQRAAFQNNTLEISRMAFAGQDLDEEYCFWTALCVATYYQNYPSIIRLIQCGADVRRRNSNGTTPLWFAAHSHGSDAAVFNTIDLLLVYGARLNSRIDAAKSTLLIWATRTKRIGVVSRLLEKQGLYVNARNANGETALTFARGLDDDEIATLLESHGARV